MKHTRGHECNTVSNGDTARRVSMESNGVDGNRRIRNEQMNRQQQNGSDANNDGSNGSSTVNGSVPQHESVRSAVGNETQQQSNSVFPEFKIARKLLRRKHIMKERMERRKEEMRLEQEMRRLRQIQYGRVPENYAVNDNIDNPTRFRKVGSLDFLKPKANRLSKRIVNRKSFLQDTRK